MARVLIKLPDFGTSASNPTIKPLDVLLTERGYEQLARDLGDVLGIAMKMKEEDGKRLYSCPEDEALEIVIWPENGALLFYICWQGQVRTSCLFSIKEIEEEIEARQPEQLVRHLLWKRFPSFSFLFA